MHPTIFYTYNNKTAEEITKIGQTILHNSLYKAADELGVEIHDSDSYDDIIYMLTSRIKQIQ